MNARVPCASVRTASRASASQQRANAAGLAQHPGAFTFAGRQAVLIVQDLTLDPETGMQKRNVDREERQLQDDDHRLTITGMLVTE
jgi:hypothetical protein